MKAFLKDFCLRGLLAAGGGPLVLAIIYLILGHTGAVTQIDPVKAGTEILSILLLAFFVAGCTAIYQVERLSLGAAILVHGGLLYIGYAVIYLLNGWLQSGWKPFVTFTVVFVVGYAIIWCIIYAVSRKKVQNVNQRLPKNS